MSDEVVVNAEERFAERAEKVQQEARAWQLARETVAPESEWLHTEVRGRLFLGAMGLDMSEVPAMEIPLDLESSSTDPEVQEARRIFKKLETMRRNAPDYGDEV